MEVESSKHNLSKYVVEKTPCYGNEGVSCNIPKNHDTQDWLTLLKYIKHGAFGSVYKGVLRDMPDYYVAIKQQYDKPDFYDFEREIMVFKQVNELVAQKKAPNFLTLIDYFICPSPDDVISDINFDSRIGKSLCGKDAHPNNVFTEVSIYELADGDLLDVKDKDVLFSLICQALLSYEIAYRLIGFVHNDFKPANVLFKKVPIDRKYFVYQTKKATWVVPNFGYYVLIGDLGLSETRQYKNWKHRANKPIEDYHRLFHRLFSILDIDYKLIESPPLLRKFMDINCHVEEDVDDNNAYFFVSDAENMFGSYEKVEVKEPEYKPAVNPYVALGVHDVEG